MLKFMTTTALVASIALTGAAAAQTATSEMFMETAGAPNLHASDLIGMRVYAAERTTDDSLWNMDESAGLQTEWQDLGEINDLFVTRDGDVASVLVDIGGFLGIGEKPVELSMDQVEITRLDNSDGFRVSVPMSQEQLDQLPTSEAEEAMPRAMSAMGDMVTGDVLIIEDEGIIAMDLKSIVTEMGHTVTDIARIRDEAIAMGRAKVPDLILADIQLADKSSGIDAVNALLQELGDRPVIFITAFPERLLTGQRPEPAFLITKPYSEHQVRAAVSQAMFFSTSQRIEA